jgi:CheY-like chemotaxis protein
MTRDGASDQVVPTMPHKLLLADDSVTIQRVIELTFADEDVQVIAVGDGQKAIERIEAEHPDIVLADVGMPERDGYEVAAFVKGAAHLAHIPVLLLTGAFEPVDEQRAAAAGCDGVLAKPFEPHMVITRVKELLAGGAGTRMPVGGPFGVAETAPPAAAEALQGAGELERAAPAGEAPVRLSRRTPIAVPGFGAPQAASESRVAALDDYFERLDAAFATLQQAPAQGADAASAPPASEGDAPAGAPAAAVTGAAASRTETDPARDAAAQRASAPGEPPQMAGIAQAFSALFAAERGETAAAIPSLVAPAAMPQHSVDDLAERVTRQVIERLSDRIVRETVADVVSQVAERLVRDEIERVKATLQ